MMLKGWQIYIWNYPLIKTTLPNIKFVPCTLYRKSQLPCVTIQTQVDYLPCFLVTVKGKGYIKTAVQGVTPNMTFRNVGRSRRKWIQQICALISKWLLVAKKSMKRSVNTVLQLLKSERCCSRLGKHKVFLGV